jgi:hypothetical protein
MCLAQSDLSQLLDPLVRPGLPARKDLRGLPDLRDLPDQQVLRELEATTGDLGETPESADAVVLILCFPR